MSRFSKTHSSFHGRRAGIVGALFLALAGQLPTVTYGGSQDRQGPVPELLGADKKSVARILGDGEPLVGGLFNEKSSEIHAGGIGSTHAYRTRIGYLEDRSCYAFFMKKTGEAFNPIEVIGLLSLCAHRAEWRELKVGSREVGFIYRAADPKGKAGDRTYLATLDESACKLFVYSPTWRPDFNRDLWTTPDEAPVHREAGKGSERGELPHYSDSKQADIPEAGLLGKPSGAFDGKGHGGDPKEGIYLPKFDQVIPADPGDDPKAVKKDKRKHRQQSTKPIPPSSGK